MPQGTENLGYGKNHGFVVQFARSADSFLRADDLIPEESDTVLLALKRLPPKEAYDRMFRLRRAFQVKSKEQLGASGLSCL